MQKRKKIVCYVVILWRYSFCFPNFEVILICILMWEYFWNKHKEGCIFEQPQTVVNALKPNPANTLTHTNK